MNISGIYREFQIVNGQVVKNVELVEQVSPEKEVIKGNINGKPVLITHSLKRSNKKGKTKHSNKKRQAKRSNKNRQTKRSKRELRTTAKK